MATTSLHPVHTPAAVVKHTRTPSVPPLARVRAWRLVRRHAWRVAVIGFFACVGSLGFVVGGTHPAALAFGGSMLLFVGGMALDAVAERRLPKARRAVRAARASRQL